MRFLLTSAGITNTSIHDALEDLLGKPVAESSALCIPTATYAMSNGAGLAWNFIAGREPRTPMCELGWRAANLFTKRRLEALVWPCRHTPIAPSEVEHRPADVVS